MKFKSFDSFCISLVFFLICSNRSTWFVAGDFTDVMKRLQLGASGFLFALAIFALLEDAQTLLQLQTSVLVRLPILCAGGVLALLCAVLTELCLELRWKVRRKLRKHRRWLCWKRSKWTEWAKGSMPLLLRTTIHTLELCAATKVLDGNMGEALSIFMPLAALALVALLCKRARLSNKPLPITEDDVRAAIIERLTAESRTQDKVDFRVSVIHRIEAAERKVAWQKYYATNDESQLSIRAFRRNDNHLLSDYEGSSIEELIISVALLEAHEKLQPFAESFAGLLARVKEADQPTWKGRARQLANAAKSSVCHWCKKLSRCFAERVLGLLWTMRFPLLAGIVTTALSACLQANEAHFLSLATVVATTGLHTIMLALLTIQLFTRQFDWLSLPAAYWLHVAALALLGEAALLLTLPHLASSLCATLRPGWLSITCASLLLLGWPLLVQYHQAGIAVAMLLQSRTVRQLASSIPGVLFNAVERIAKQLRVWRCCTSTEELENDEEFNAICIPLANTVFLSFVLQTHDLLASIMNLIAIPWYIFNSAAELELDCSAPGVPLAAAAIVQLAEQLQHILQVLQIVSLMKSSKQIWDEFTGFDFDATKGYPGEGPKRPVVDDEGNVYMVGSDDEEMPEEKGDYKQGTNVVLNVC